MGYTVFGRWKEADEKSFTGLLTHITQFHGGVSKSQWALSARFYRSTAWPSRTISSITLGETCFVLCEDTNASSQGNFAARSREMLAKDPNSEIPIRPPHYRSTYMTFTPPNILPMLFQQLGGVWSNRVPGAHADIEIQGLVFAIGEDIIIRAGRVAQRGEPRGVVIEAELVPMAKFIGDEPKLLQELIKSITPINADVKAVSFSDEQWEEIITNPEAESKSNVETSNGSDDIFAYKDDDVEDDPKDWTGINRDKRSAFLLLRLFVTESTQPR